MPLQSQTSLLKKNKFMNKFMLLFSFLIYCVIYGYVIIYWHERLQMNDGVVKKYDIQKAHINWN